MSDDLQARLREDSWVNASHRADRVRKMCLEAAAEIARLTSEVERLEKDRDEWKETAEGVRLEYHVDYKFWRERNGTLKAKADALAEAAREYQKAVAYSLPERTASTALIKIRREASSKLKAALTDYQEGK